MDLQGDADGRGSATRSGDARLTIIDRKHTVNRIDPSGLEPILPNNPEATRALSIVLSRIPDNWSRNITFVSEVNFWKNYETSVSKGAAAAGYTRSGQSYINAARLNQLSGTDRLFKYIETISHELYHQNYIFAKEADALDYGRNFLKDFVESRECDPKLKKAYDKYLDRFQLIEILWGGSGAY